MKLARSLLALSTLPALVSAQSYDKLPAASVLSPTDKTLWLVPDQVAVGTILATDPSAWSKSRGVFFTPYSRFLEGKIATNTGPQLSETLTLDKRFDLAAVLPFLKILSGSFRSQRKLTLTATDEDIAQVSSQTAIKNVFQRYDRPVGGGEEAERRDLFGALNAKTGGVYNTSATARYWLVTKVYRAKTSSFTALKSNGVSVGVGCLTPPAVPAAAATPEPTASPAATPSASATPDGKASNNTKQAGGKMGGSLSADSSGKLSVTLSSSPGTALTGAAATGAASTSNASTSTPAANANCAIGQVVISSNGIVTMSTTGAILFIQIKPIFKNSAGTLYVPIPDGTDQIVAPKTITRS
jgi:hypothetical protein